MSAERDELILGYLIAVKTVLRAVQSNVDMALAAFSDGDEDDGAEAPCEHTDNELVSAMGSPPRYRCKTCGAEFEKEAAW